MTEPQTGTGSDVQQFWDTVYDRTEYSRKLSADQKKAVRAAVDHFGDVKGKSILDIGCGGGATSFLFGSLGATVTGIDISPVAINSLNERAQDLGMPNVRGVVHDAKALDALGRFDFIYGSMILHHIEPFDRFAGVLERSLDANGKAFFYENNAASRLLVWFRDNMVGKLWVPKNGDPEEFPLTPQEVDCLRERFAVTIQIPEMYFLRLISIYLLRGFAVQSFIKLDKALYERDLLTRYSYRQYVKLDAAA